MERNANDVFAGHGVVLSEDELAHYGKLGMRWGKRHNSASSGSHETHATAKPNVKKMSDEELKTAINRLKMEKEFTKLTSPEISKGRQIVGNILLDVGKQQSKDYLNREITKLIVQGGIKGALKAAAKGAPAAAAAAAPVAARTVMKLNSNHGL